MTNAKFFISPGSITCYNVIWPYIYEPTPDQVVDQPSTYGTSLNTINMHLVLDDADDNVQHIKCHHCHWQGSSGELERGDYFPLGNFTEVFCPACNKYLGFIQHASGEAQ